MPSGFVRISSPPSFALTADCQAETEKESQVQYRYFKVHTYYEYNIPYQYHTTVRGRSNEAKKAAFRVLQATQSIANTVYFDKLATRSKLNKK